MIVNDPRSAVLSKWPTADVHYLILQADEFIVFLDEDLVLDWVTSDEYDKHGPEDRSRHNEILNRAASLECVPNDHHKKSIRLNFKRMLGEGVAAAILQQAQLYITNRNIEIARFWQLSTACVIGLAVAILGAVQWTFRETLVNAWNETGYYVLGSALAGCVGAVLSMIFRMGNTFPTSEAPKALHMLEAVSRVFAGAISGLLISGSVAIGLILPVFGKSGEMHGAMLVAALASGASERWAPSLIGRLEARSEELRSGKGKPK
jgi:hypothetical protein